MRTDLASMNPGKACAQASHATNMFMKNHGSEKDVIDWTNETKDGFGTVLVMGTDLATMTQVWIDCFNNGIMTGIVNDPTYPIRDGNYTHLVPCETCAYAFGERTIIGAIMDRYKISLMP